MHWTDVSDCRLYFIFCLGLLHFGLFRSHSSVGINYYYTIVANKFCWGYVNRHLVQTVNDFFCGGGRTNFF